MNTLRRAALLLGAACCGLSAAAQEDALRVCLPDGNPPYADRARAEGFDLDVAAAAATILGLAAEPVWVPGARAIDEIESDLPLARLARGECDVLLSVPGPASATLAGQPTLALGAAYYGAAFELVACGEESPSALRALRGRRVAIRSQTVAHFALLMVQAESRTFFAVDAALAGLAAGEAEAALLWGPVAGWHLASGDYARCGFAPDYTPPPAVRWNVHPATRRTDERLRLRLDAALADLAASGRLAALAAQHGVRLHAPFESVYSLGALNALQRPGPAGP